MTLTNSPLAITMWDFSWLERRWDGAGYQDWDRALDELVERGYDAVRIDAFPHLVAADPERTWRLLPVWHFEAWGATEPVSVRVLPDLLEFIQSCAVRGLRVALSSWFRKDELDTRLSVRTAADLARIWDVTLTAIERAGLADAIYFVDLVNEWPLAMWAPFLYGNDPDAVTLSRGDEVVRSWTREAIGTLRAAHPRHRYTLSVCTETTGADGEDLSELDLLEPHVWMTPQATTDFYDRIGYDLHNSQFDPRAYEPLSGPAERLYRADPERWAGSLAEHIGKVAEWSRSAGKPLVTTECWGIVNYKDGPGRDWGWVKELCESGVRAALATGRWEALATSNFCGPQFTGMWRDIAWHRRMTDAIHAGVTEFAPVS
ncbi:cellulase-like family protein [Nonomuraea sp. NPDC049400]|uniref:cellulase-like family protein n=1 Tax=Nonomuraea sp. NPDC049400 TaxID=3364352 RepID=UPI0037B9025B